MRVNLLSTRQSIHANLTNEHVTVLITTNGEGKQAPPYLLFPGENLAAIPKQILDRSDAWGNFSPKGWMDVERFQAWMLKFIDEVNRRKTPAELTDYTLLIIDGHNS